MSQSMAMSASAESRAPASRPELDRAVDRLRARTGDLTRTPARARAALLRECVRQLADAAPAWVADGCRAKGLSDRTSGEEWLAGPVPTIRGARLLAESLEAIAERGRPPLGTGTRTGPGGRLAIDLFPAGIFDRLLFGGFSAYALMQPGVDRAAAARRQAELYQRPAADDGGVALILGAGNVSSIPPLDVLSKMFVEGYTCLLKINPVNEWVGPHLARGLAPLVARGYLEIVYGGAEVGAYLVAHDGVDDVHITGSDRTHDLIVWGPPGADRDRRIEAGEPVLDKPISSELGNVSPVAVVPYSYTDDELWFQARNVASMVVNNGSFNCNAAKLLITARDWAQRHQFLDLVGKALSQAPTRKAYYPGAFDRYRALTEGRRVDSYGRGDDQRLPWALIRDVDATDASDPIFSTEPFCGLLSETCVGSADPVEFLASVTEFMNETLWGTLNAAIVIHPQLERDATVRAALDRAIVDLRYGTVAINHWPALGYAFGTTPWGGHPSSTLRNIQSGLGWVHNTFMLDGIDKAVVRGPLRVWPHPVWFYDHNRSHEVGRLLAAFEAEPAWRKLPRLVAAAVRPG
jgi:acyl-CoA reductase-like NAD-dependent aldehyde dehydrogenase